MIAPRELPADEAAERHVLSCCVMDGATTLARCMELGVTERTFHGQPNAVLFGLLLGMLADGKAIDVETVALELRTQRKVEEIGGWSAFAGVTGSAPTTAQAVAMARRIVELAVLREVIATAARLVESCYGYAGDPLEEVLGGPVGRLLALSTRDASPEPPWSVVVDQAEARLAQMLEQGDKPAADAVSFPWPEMTARFAPMQRGQLVIIAARTSIGKSSLLRPIVCGAARAGGRVYYDTLEVQPVQVVLQLAAMLSRIGVRGVAKAHHRDQEDFRTALRGLRGAGITISRKDRALAQVVARAKALRAQGPLDIVAIDHGGLLSEVFNAPRDERIVAIGRMTKTLKHLAGELGCVVVLLWQLNRDSEKDRNREPRLSDLRDCGSLEEDADKILLIHRPSVDPLTKMAQADTDSVEDRPRFFQNVIQAKGRDDGTALMSFYFDRSTAAFAPAKKEEAPGKGVDFAKLAQKKREGRPAESQEAMDV